MNTLLAWAPLVLPVMTAVVVMVLDMYDVRPAAVAAAAIGLALSGAAAAAGVSGEVRALSGAFVTGRWVSGVLTVLLLLSATAVLAGLGSAGRNAFSGSTAALVSLSSAGAVAAVSAADLVMLVIALEVIALSGYGLTAAAGTRTAREAAMKYLVQGSVVAGVSVISLALFSALSGGSFAYGTLRGAAVGSPASALLVVLLTVVVAFKSSAFPFHSWAPDVYQAADPVSAGFMASVPKAAVMVVAAVLVGRLVGGTRYAWVVAVIAVSTILFGNAVGLHQRSYRRMLAYSAIAHAGYALSGLVAPDARGPLAVYGVVYGLGVLAAFLVEPAVRETHPAWDGTIAGLAGLGRRRPLVAVSATVAMLSLTGIPLTGGFWGKYAVFSSYAAGPWMWLAIVAVLGSVVSFGYYGGVLRALYLDSATAEQTGGGEPGAATIALVACATALVVAGIAPLFLGIRVIFSVLGLS